MALLLLLLHLFRHEPAAEGRLAIYRPHPAYQIEMARVAASITSSWSLMTAESHGSLGPVRGGPGNRVLAESLIGF
jgi:hypothetical protein